MHREYDVIIVGSGVGGGTAADYLTRKNPEIKIAIIESGPFYTKKNFNQVEIDMTALYFNRGAILSKNLEIGIAAGNTLGGSSSVYTGVSFRPPETVLDNWRNEFHLDFLSDQYVNSSLDEIEKELSVHELPESWDNDNNKLFKKGAEALDIPVKRLKINTKDCQQQGFCNLGCTTGAKQGILEVQLPKVMAHGVDVICNAYVESVEEHWVHIIVSKAPEGSRPNRLAEGEHQLHAEKIILAAGALNTPAILLRSAHRLKLRNQNIGRYLTLHPAFNVNGIYKEKVNNYRGFPKTYYTDYFSDTEGFYLETSFYFPGVTAKNIPGFGKSHSEIMKDYHKMMSILVLVHDKARHHNRISLDNNRGSVVNYTIDRQTKSALITALREASRLFFAAGCTKVLIPGSNKFPLLPTHSAKLEKHITRKNLNFARNPLSSAHPQGGARMGGDRIYSVCDPYGAVYGTNSIYVADASLFPTSAKVNPYETVMLLSKWVAENLSL